jgi:4-hydroxy-tetrahydrodipicolinate synthase
MPFDEGEKVDHEGLCRQVDFVIGEGVQACAFGFASEIQRLTERELEDALATVVAEARGRIHVVANIGVASTAAAEQRMIRVGELGAAAVMMPPPYPFPSTDEGIIEFYERVSRCADVAIVIQDAPASTGVALSPELLARLAIEIDAVAALKLEPIPSPPKVEAVVSLVGDAATVLGGSGGVEFYAELERGVHGTMPGSAFPKLFLKIYECHRDGRIAEARASFNRLLPLLTASSRTGDGFLFVQKEILRRRGVIDSARLRSPCELPSQSFCDELDVLINDAGLDLGVDVAAMP